MSEILGSKEILIIIDALDECGLSRFGEEGSRGSLLETIKRLSQLSRKVKIFITSRQEADIRNKLQEINLECINLFEANASYDIEMYIASQKGNLKQGLCEALSDAKTVNMLVEMLGL
jgi:hypothetical protein